jgi:uncharacterized protein
MRVKQYQVTNARNQQLLATEVRLANTYFKRLFGLMGKPGLPTGAGLWIVPCNSIHSALMRFEFDAVFVDKDNQVLHLIHRMKPWGLSPMIKGAKAVLELPGGTLAALDIQPGDPLRLEPTVL